MPSPGDASAPRFGQIEAGVAGWRQHRSAACCRPAPPHRPLANFRRDAWVATAGCTPFNASGCGRWRPPPQTEPSQFGVFELEQRVLIADARLLGGDAGQANKVERFPKTPQPRRLRSTPNSDTSRGEPVLAMTAAGHLQSMPRALICSISPSYQGGLVVVRAHHERDFLQNHWCITWPGATGWRLRGHFGSG